MVCKLIFERQNGMSIILIAKVTKSKKLFRPETSVHPYVRPCVRPSVPIFFQLKSPWNHPLTSGVDPRGIPGVAPGLAAPLEELARARRALSSSLKKWNLALNIRRPTIITSLILMLRCHGNFS